jgi:hypothetical protein
MTEERGISRAGGIDVTAFILAFLIPVLGVILGVVAVFEAHKAGRRASGLAVAAIAIGGVLVMIITIIALSVISVHTGPDPTQLWQSCMQTAVDNGIDPGTCPVPGN